MTTRRILIDLLVLYALSMAYTVGMLGLDRIPSPIITPLTTLLGFTFALLHAAQRLGWKRALILLGCVFVISLVFEGVGVATGWIYGPYHYDSQKLGPLLLGLVPPLIPIAWFMMMYPSYVIADRLVPSSWGRWVQLFVLAAVGGLVMTAWDLVMDPAMVGSGHWTWEVEGAYFGIPLQNFLGWWVTVFTTFAVYLLLAGRGQADQELDQQTLILYGVTGLSNSLVLLSTGFGGPALVGIFAMAPWVVTGWLRMNNRPLE